MGTKKVRIGGIVTDSLVDGPGLRFVIFFQGCPHHCFNCHNKDSWDYNKGRLEDVNEIVKLWQTNKMIDGITFSGGEPFLQPASLFELIKKAKEDNLHVLIYTGYLYEDLISLNDETINNILAMSDILIDGPYIDSKRDVDLLYRGSSNQRIINLKK